MLGGLNNTAPLTVCVCVCVCRCLEVRQTVGSDCTNTRSRVKTRLRLPSTGSTAARRRFAAGFQVTLTATRRTVSAC